MDVVMVVAGVVALLVAALLGHLQRWSISPPMLGLVAGVLVGPEVLGALTIAEAEQVRVMQVAARLLLAVALMAIGLRYPISQMRQRIGPVVVLVVVVMPIMALVLAAGASWLLQVPLALALVLGACLSPTDPVLASGVVTGEAAEESVPARSRQVLSLESGANDGLAMPLVIMAVAWALGRPLLSAAGVSVYEVVAGGVIGLGAGYLGGRLLRWSKEHREMGQSVRSLYTLVLAAFVLGLSGVVRADGLLSVLVAGLAHNAVVSGSDRGVEVGIDETLTQFLVIPVFVLLGAVLPWTQWAQLGWRGALFVAVALVLRRIPAVLLLRPALRSTWADAAWLGWFGPIGVAALFYLGHAHEQGVTNSVVWAAGTLVVAASTLVHGLTAGAGRWAYRRS